MPITANEVERLAALARIELSEKEKEGLQKDISAIVAYVSQIQRLSAAGAEETGVAPADAPVNVMRDDAAPHESGAYTETLLAAAPRREGQYVRVKKIL